MRGRMKLEGIHHVTAITGDAPANVEFYAGMLGLRLVKKTVNQDDPTVYHLFYADERGQRGRRHHLLRVPGRAAGPRRRRDGAPRRLPRRLGGGARLLGRAHGRRAASSARVLFDDPEGLALELVVDDSGDEPLVAEHPEIPEELALRGFAGVRAYASDPGAQRAASSYGLGFTPGWEARGEQRGGFYVYDDPPAARGLPGAGTVHHVAWASTMEEHEAWREQVALGRAGSRRR